MDETYVKVRSRGAYLHRAVDKHGNTIDFHLSPAQNAKVAVVASVAPYECQVDRDSRFSAKARKRTMPCPLAPRQHPQSLVLRCLGEAEPIGPSPTPMAAP